MEIINIFNFIVQHWLMFVGLQFIMCALAIKIYKEYTDRKENKKTLVRCTVVMDRNFDFTLIDEIKLYLGINEKINGTIGCGIGWKSNIEPIQARILLLMVLFKKLEEEIPELSKEDWIELSNDMWERLLENSQETFEGLTEPNEKFLHMIQNNENLVEIFHQLHDIVENKK